MPRSTDLDKIASDNTLSPPATPSASSAKIYNIFGHTQNPLSALLVNPHVFNFPEKDEHEDILLVARQHWVTNVPWIVVTIFMIFFPLIFTFVPLVTGFSSNYQSVAILFWYLVTFAYAFEKFLSWYFNVYIITTQRVIDIDFNNLLIKKYSDAEIVMIQDVSSAVIGAIPTVFNYGNVLVQTASEINEITFERVPDPEKIIKLLQELRDEHDQGVKK